VIVALGVQHSRRMLLTILPSAASPGVQYFAHYLINGTIFEKVTEHTFCLKRFLTSEEMSEIVSKTYIGLHIKYQLFLSDFNET